jgi:hypothetical protein
MCFINCLWLKKWLVLKIRRLDKKIQHLSASRITLRQATGDSHAKPSHSTDKYNFYAGTVGADCGCRPSIGMVIGGRFSMQNCSIAE